MPPLTEKFINAVERLDCQAIEQLLDPHRLYCGVSKEVFMQSLRKIFEKIRNDANIPDALTAIKAKCNHSGLHSNPVIFVDSLKFGNMSLNIEIDENGTLLLELCEDAHHGEACIYNFNQLKFYPDDKPNFMWSATHVQRKDAIKYALNDFDDEYETEGILYPEFLIEWVRAAAPLQEYDSKNFTFYRYQEEIWEIYNAVYPFFQLAAWSNDAERIQHELKCISAADDMAILNFLRKTENNYPYIEFSVLQNWDMEKGFVTFQGFRFFITPLITARESYLQLHEHTMNLYEKGIISESLHPDRRCSAITQLLK